MARLTKEMLEKKEYYQMPKWIYGIEDLKPVDREIYMLGLNNWRLSIENNWINDKGEVYFVLSQEKVGKFLYVSSRTVMRSIEKLVENGLLQVETSNGSPNKYFLVDLNIEKIELKTLQNFKKNEEKNYKTTDKMSPVSKSHQCQNVTQTTDKMSPRPLTNCHTNKNNIIRTNNKAVAQEEPAAATFENFKKDLKKVLPREFQDINQNTVKNIFNYSKGDINAVREAIAYMIFKQKPMKASTLVAIIKEGDYKKSIGLTTSKPITRQGKIEYMLGKLKPQEIESIKKHLENKMGLTGHHLENHLGNILCQKYNSETQAS